MISDNLAERLSRMQSLPTIPSIAMRIVDIARRDEPDPDALLGAIRADPALSVRLLHVANSPLYSRGKGVHRVREAYLTLGYKSTLTLALSFSLMRVMTGFRTHNFDHATFWRHAACTAATARVLARHHGDVDAEEALLAGMLKDIGALAMSALGDDGTQTGVTMSDGERGAIGLWLMEHWEMPRYLGEACWASQDIVRRAEHVDAGNRLLCEIVGVSAEITNLWLSRDPDEALRGARTLTKRLWQWDDDELTQTLDEVVEAIPAALRMLEIEPPPAETMSETMERARELLANSSIHTLEEARKAKYEAARQAQRAQEMEQQSQLDPLTGLPNRRHLFDALQAAESSFRAHGTPYVVAFIDIDDFKAVNDTHGHAAGDQVLVEFARRVSSQLRTGDVLARYGGEEFLILYPNVALPQAKASLERILKMIAHHPFPVGTGSEIYITASIGATPQRADTQHVSIDAALNAADKAVYHSKDSGRARLTLAIGATMQQIAVVRKRQPGSLINRLKKRWLKT